MTKLTQEQVNEVMRLHRLWLDDEPDGVRANLSDKDLSGLNFKNAQLTGANLAGANLTGANFSFANLTNTNRTHANFRYTNFRYANCQYADFTHANFTHANFRGANFEGANLTCTNFEDAFLWDCTGDGKRIRTTRTKIYAINHYDDRCQIGCRNHSLAEWAAFSDEEIDAMSTSALDWWKEWREFVLTEGKVEE